MKLLLVSLLVALPELAFGDLLFQIINLESNGVKQCAIAAGITEDQYAQILTNEELPDDKDVACKLVTCSLQEKGLIKDGKLDKTAAEEKIKKEITSFITAKAAVPDFSQCLQKSAEGQSACQEAMEYILCAFIKVTKYNSPLLESSTPTLTRCQKENNVSDDDVNAFDYKAQVPKSREAKCMLACLLEDKGAVFENKLDVEYINSKIMEDLDESPVRRYATSVPDFIEDFKKCSPSVTDPAGTKDVCDGAYDLYSCMYKTENKYYPKNINHSILRVRRIFTK